MSRKRKVEVIVLRPHPVAPYVAREVLCGTGERPDLSLNSGEGRIGADSDPGLNLAQGSTHADIMATYKDDLRGRGRQRRERTELGPVEEAPPRSGRIVRGASE